MKFVIHTVALLFLLGGTTSTFARQEEKGRSEEAKPAEQAKPAQQHAPQAKPAQQKPQHAQQAKPAPQQQAQHAKPAQPAHAQQARASAGHSAGGAHGRISDAHYRASFGSGHNFHVNQGEFNNHRFAYGGYSFGFGAPWPVGWLYTDAVYVDYVDGAYFMFDPVHPGVRLSINII